MRFTFAVTDRRRQAANQRIFRECGDINTLTKRTAEAVHTFMVNQVLVHFPGLRWFCATRGGCIIFGESGKGGRSFLFVVGENRKSGKVYNVNEHKTKTDSMN